MLDKKVFFEKRWSFMQEWQNKLMGVTTENDLKHPEGL
jgi:hypothetical protein